VPLTPLWRLFFTIPALKTACPQNKIGAGYNFLKTFRGKIMGRVFRSRTLALILGFSATALGLGGCGRVELDDNFRLVSTRYILKANNPDDTLIAGDPHLTDGDIETLIDIYKRKSSTTLTGLVNRIADKRAEEDPVLINARRQYRSTIPKERREFEKIIEDTHQKWRKTYEDKLAGISKEIAAAKGIVGRESLYAVMLVFNPDKMAYQVNRTGLEIKYASEEAAREFYFSIRENRSEAMWRRPLRYAGLLGRTDSPTCFQLTYTRYYHPYSDDRRSPPTYSELARVEERYDYLVRIRQTGWDSSIEVLTCDGKLAGSIKDNKFIPRPQGALAHMARMAPAP
jgi:hypothetical protein